MNPSEKGEGLVRAGLILRRKSMYFLPRLHSHGLYFGIQNVDFSRKPSRSLQRNIRSSTQVDQLATSSRRQSCYN